MMILHVVQCDYRAFPFPLNLLALAIKKVQRTGYNHYALKFTGSDGRTRYVDASGAGVKVWHKDDFKKKYKVEGKFSFDVQKKPELFEKYIEKYLNKPYGYLQLVGIFVKCVFKLERSPLRDGTKSLICTEFVGRVLNAFVSSKIQNLDSIDLNGLEKALKELSK